VPTITLQLSLHPRYATSSDSLFFENSIPSEIIHNEMLKLNPEPPRSMGDGWEGGFCQNIAGPTLAPGGIFLNPDFEPSKFGIEKNYGRSNWDHILGGHYRK
jgi:hypothetical protein